MVSTRTTRVVAGAALALGTVAWSAPATMAAPHGVVVSEVYGGGGNSGATWTNDFVELYNTGPSVVSLEGWSVQYAGASGTTYQVTPLSGSIAAGAHYLVAEAAGSGGTTMLPAADDEGSIAMGSSRGKVALVRGTGALTCGSVCHAADGVEDFVGYDADDFEGTAPAPATSNTTSASRKAGQDTDDNAADFQTDDPSPTNAAGQSTGRSAVVSGLQVHDVQGAAQLSPYLGATVLDVPGVVTAIKRSGGFWMQSTSPDDDPATSEGVYVFTRSRPSVSVGDAVTVSGKVGEYRAGSTGLTTTELDRPLVTVVASGNDLPAATLVGPGGRVPPATVIEDDADGDAEHQRSFDPAEDGIDFWESMEAMRVAIDSAQVVGPTNQYGETPVVPDGSGLRTARGGILATAEDYNPERVILGDTLLEDDPPSANTGDTLAGTTVGVLDYAFGNFMLEPTTTPTVLPGGITREVTRDDHGSELSIASFNVENLDPRDPAAKLDGLAGEIVHNLASPDIVGLEEVQDDTGPVDDGTVSADETLRLLTDAIARAGGPSYRWTEIDPANDREGGQPGGNIRVAFLYRPGASLQLVRRGEPSSTEGTAVTGGHLTRSPGRIDPASPAWEDSRVPLAAEFTWRGEPLFVIGNHFASKGGDDPLMGRRQPPVRSSEAKRHQQAQVVRGFVDDLLTSDPSARVAVLGDLNDFEYSQTADILVGSGPTALTDLPRTLPAPERYTYVYEGNSQVLDHILLSPGLAAQRYAYDVVHVNAEFADQLSDHDPQVVRLGRSTVRR